jgi:hypothetical protein
MVPMTRHFKLVTTSCLPVHENWNKETRVDEEKNAETTPSATEKTHLLTPSIKTCRIGPLSAYFEFVSTIWSFCF